MSQHRLFDAICNECYNVAVEAFTLNFSTTIGLYFLTRARNSPDHNTAAVDTVPSMASSLLSLLTNTKNDNIADFNIRSKTTNVTFYTLPTVFMFAQVNSASPLYLQQVIII